jgi:hypothetical protein
MYACRHARSSDEQTFLSLAPDAQPTIALLHPEDTVISSARRMGNRRNVMNHAPLAAAIVLDGQVGQHRMPDARSLRRGM